MTSERPPWALDLCLPLGGAAVNRAERTVAVMLGPRGAQTPKLGAGGKPVFNRTKSREALAWRAESVALLAYSMQQSQWTPSDRHALLACALGVYVRNPAQDVDSTIKATLDAVQAAIRQVMPVEPDVLLACLRASRQPPGWRDSSILELAVGKYHDVVQPRIRVRIREISQAELAGRREAG